MQSHTLQQNQKPQRKTKGYLLSAARSPSRKAAFGQTTNSMKISEQASQKAATWQASLATNTINKQYDQNFF